MKINIAIDGPSAAGKSTIADLLCEKLGYIHIDTGAMYRCVAYMAYKKGIDVTDEEKIKTLLKDIEIELTPQGKVLLNQEDVTEKIRENHISMNASTVSKLSCVRTDMVDRQRKMALSKGYIMDGRDIGTVVLPDAEVKIFLTASASARAKRRYLQNIEKNIPTKSLDELEQEIAQRDYQDSTRQISPLKQAQDAILIDSSELSIQEVVDQIYQIVLEKGGC